MTHKETYRVFSGTVLYTDNSGIARKTSFTIFRHVAATVTVSELCNLLKLHSISQIKKLLGFKLTIESVTFYV